MTLWQNHRIELAREATAQERDRAQQVSAFLVDVFSQADPFTAQGKEPTAKELLGSGCGKNLRQSESAARGDARSFSKASVSPTGAKAWPSGAIPLFEQAVAIRRQERPLDNSPYRRGRWRIWPAP